jgi:hypothetical protein
MRTLALAVALLICAPAVADARVWRGETTQGRGVSVRTGDEGEVERVRVGWKARCRNGSYTSRTYFKVPFDMSGTTAFEDAGSYRSRRLRGGFRGHHRVHVQGTLAGDRWTGTFRVRTRVTRRGRTVDRCRLKSVSWTAGPT